MTNWEDVKNDPRCIRVLDHGFVLLVDHMGSDEAIAKAARVSYGAGTKSVREDRGLIRYLFRHKHSSPIEMAEVKFMIRLPIFVMRQLIRHRTSSTNEYSARYSIMTDDFYVPDAAVIQPQSTNNRQGRAGDIAEISCEGIRWMMQTAGETAYDIYQVALGKRTGRDENYPNDLIYDPYSETDPLLDPEFPGIARELARTVLPVSYYTECYWKQDLKNLLDLLKLRMDHGAQYEIRVFAEAMYTLIKPIFPLACEAAEDYLFKARNFSRMELELLKDSLKHHEGFGGLLEDYGHDEGALCNRYGLTKRELSEFKSTFSY